MRPVKLGPGTIVVQLSQHDAMCLINALHEHASGTSNSDEPLCDALAAALTGYALIAEGKEYFQEEDGGMLDFWAKWATHQTSTSEHPQLRPPRWWGEVAVVWDNDPKEATK